MIEEYEHGHMRRLRKFTMIHSVIAECIIVRVEFVDSLSESKNPLYRIKDFPPQITVIDLPQAKLLLAALKKSIGYIESGIEHPSGEFPD